MDEPTRDRRNRGSDSGAESLLLSLVSAGLFLYVGFVMGLQGMSENAVYNGSVAALTWGARMVGIGLLIATALTFFRVPGAAILDLLLAALATGGCLIIGIIWIVFSDMEGFLLLLFGALNASATRAAWIRWQNRPIASRGGDETQDRD
jgi:hypothetical protein